MLPLSNPKSLWGEDTGCSIVAFCEINESTLEQLHGDNPPPWVRLFQKFCEGPAGRARGPKTDPNRSLGKRCASDTAKDRQTGILKAIGWCENEDELNVPQWLRAFNGQHFVITDSGYVVKDPQGEWMELGFDVRQFPFLFKEVLYKFSYFLPKGQYHCGFTIQASEEEYLPEGLICDMFLSGLNILETPVDIAF